MNFKSTVTSDTKSIDNMIRRLGKVEDYEAEYGYFEGDIHQSSGLDITALVTVLEEDRPFMSLAMELCDQKIEVSNQWKRDLWDYLRGNGTIVSFYKLIGKIGEKAVEDAIQYGDWINTHPNSPDWAEYKFVKYGVSQPLIETGEMLYSVKSKAKKRNP